MSRIKKAVTKLLEGRSDANFSFADLCFILDRAGFTSRRGRGSHSIFFRDDVAEIINLQPRGGQAKPYQVKQVRDLLVKYQIDFE
jgi:hypothetical protein